MSEDIRPEEWYQEFRRIVREHRWAEPLRAAALAGRLRSWTQHLTGAVVATCSASGWTAVARGHPSEVLPVPKQEYLAVDIMAFPARDGFRWTRPIASFELENRPELEAVSYSLWKVSMIRCLLGGVFCYRRQPDEIASLIANLTHNVMAQVYPVGEVGGELLVVVGTRSKAEGFPDGFFKPYTWEPSARRFRALW